MFLKGIPCPRSGTHSLWRPPSYESTMQSGPPSSPVAATGSTSSPVAHASCGRLNRGFQASQAQRSAHYRALVSLARSVPGPRQKY
ncbi:hypothetical protein GQ53DRAFT_756596 [Thozetella sp. PMI_491]|nr:hypothetical protein GQ53DRAFT_756596 [Thozetella sp. PMI_491]